MRGGCNLVGCLMVLALYGLIGMHFYAFIYVVCPLMKARLGTEMGMVWVAVGLIILYNILFNHFWAMAIKPGSPKDLIRIEQMRSEQKNRAFRKSIDHQLDDKDEDWRFEGLSSDVKKLLRYRSKTSEQLREFWTKKCVTCDDIKPARTHHCKVCGTCVMLMDHHCPWVNNCVGLENYRYFLLFVFYLAMGSGYMCITMYAVKHHFLFKQHKQLMLFLSILDAVLAISMVLFSAWNWFLAMFGTTTVEFMKNEGIGSDKREAKLRFESIGDNLYRIFGTHKIFRIFSPSFRNVPFTGLEWSFRFKDEGYDCDGLIEGSMDEELAEIRSRL